MSGNLHENWIEADVVGVVGQTGSLPAAVDFPKYHDVPPVSFSFDIWEEKTNKLVQFGACEITEKG